jgi:ABC-type nitrate/sulfonate/bicarbonate transport system substrate-binding protein
VRRENSLSRRVWGIAIAAFVLAIVVVFGFGLVGTARLFPAPVQPVDKLTIALSSTPHAGLLHLAAAKGYFADEGLAVTLVPVSHGKAAMDLLAQGKTDLAAAAEVPFVISILKGEAIAIAATVVSVSTEMAVVARRDRAIAAPRDLVGKKIGVTFGTSGEYFLWAFLIRNKLAPDSVTLVDVAPGQIAQELASGTIDATSTWEPIRFKAQSALGNNGVSFNADNAYTVTHVVVGRNDFLKGHPRAIEKLVRAMLKAEQFNRAEPEQALMLAAERLKMDVKTLRPAWKDLSFKVDLRQSQLITLEDEARWAMARGYAEKGNIPNFLPHLYLDALLAVQPERVTVVR